MLLPRFFFGETRWHRYCLSLSQQTHNSYALTENLTYESAIGGMQGSSSQYPIVSTAVPDGDKGYRYVVQDGRF